MSSLFDIKIGSLYKIAAIKMADRRVEWRAQAHLAGMAVRY